jgi:hypothetical protein
MKKIFITILFAATIASAQKSDETPTLTEWRGGTISFDAGLGLNMLGAGMGSATAGGVLSPRLNNGAASIFYNPAELFSLTSPNIIIDSRIGIGTGTFGLAGNSLLSDQELSTQTDTFLKDSSIFKYDKVNGFKVPSKVSSGSAGFPGRLTSFSVGIPVAPGLAIGFGSYYPIDMNIGLRVSDVSMKLQAARETGTQTIGIDFLLNLGVTSDMIVRSNVMNFGFGVEAFNKPYGQLSLGASAKRYDVRTMLDLDMTVDGLISIQKVEYYFNNPADRAIDFASGETNALGWSAHGDYRDTRWGFTVGAYYNALALIDSSMSALNVSIVYDKSPSFTMTDANAKSVSYEPAFLVGKPGGTGSDSMQIMIDSLKLSKPNLTHPTQNVFSTTMTLNQASSLTLGLDLGFGRNTLALNYVKYFGDYALTFADYRIGKTLSSGVKVGADFAMPSRLEGWSWLLLPVRLLFLDIDGMLFQAFPSTTGYTNSHYRFGGGVVTGTAIASGMKAETASSLRTTLGSPLPVGFSMGRQYTIFSRYTIGVMVFGVPDIAFKTTLGIML